jgi:hypothetical protein
MIPEPIANAQLLPAVTARRMSRITSPDIGMVPWGAAARAVLTAEERKKAPKALGDDYPIGDEEHGRKAVQLSTHESPANRAKILAAVHRRFPQIKIAGKD